MPEKPFKFKEFIILQDRCAMKVGTDGVLLGAWVTLAPSVDSILDIGTGTGLIALQLAQRCNAQVIDAVEIETNAFEQAVENFENSDWSDRLYCYHASLQKFKEEIDEKYDLIVSNPPYFNDTYKALKEERMMARHTSSLSFEELLRITSAMLSEEGTCAFIIPFREEEIFIEIARQHGLYPQRITRVRGHGKSPLKRSLLHLGRSAEDLIINELTIESERHLYTENYKDLVKDFYLKM